MNAIYHKRTHLEHSQNDDDGDGGQGAPDVAQNDELDRTYKRIRAIAETHIIPHPLSIESQDLETRRLACFDRRFKDIKRLELKVARQLCLEPSRTFTEELAVVSDVVRFTLVYFDQNEYGAGVLKDMRRLRRRGFRLVGLRNAWADDEYKGINTQWRELSSGLVFEIQFHTQESLRTREVTHWAYERIRNGDGGEGIEIMTLRAFQRQTNAMVSIPAGALRIICKL